MIRKQEMKKSVQDKCFLVVVVVVVVVTFYSEFISLKKAFQRLVLVFVFREILALW